MTVAAEGSDARLREAHEAADALRRVSDLAPRALVVLGSGLESVVERMEVTATARFTEIPHMPAPKVEGHSGRFIWGRAGGVPVLVMQGRVHFYEGHPMSKVVLGVRAARLIGCDTLVITNAAGGVAPRLSAGDIVVLTDHVNLMFTNPLIGANIDEFGPRFPPMVGAYDPGLRDLAKRVAADLAIELEEGIYAALSGPTFETPAEVQMLRTLGVDVVGMSTVPEVIAAVHVGMRVLGFSLVSNIAAGSSHGHEEVLVATAERAPQLSRIITGVLSRM